VLHIEGVYSGTNENVFPSTKMYLLNEIRINRLKLSLSRTQFRYCSNANLDHICLWPTAYCQMNWNKKQKGPQRNNSIYIYIFTFHTGLEIKFQTVVLWLLKKNWASPFCLLLARVHDVVPCTLLEGSGGM